METTIIKAFGTEAVNVPLHEMNINTENNYLMM
jgi:hypothetical protein